MMRSSGCMLLVFSLALTAARPLRAQSDTQDDQAEAAGMAQIFGTGNAVRGTVTVAAAAPETTGAGTTGDFTIRTDDGEVYRVLYSPNTRMMRERQPTKPSEIHVGDMLIAGGQVDRKAKTVGAVFIYDVDAAEVRQARAGFGKSWIAGKVIAIHDLKITIERADDKRSEMIAVDINTSFRKRRDDITLGDVKIGDFITSQGAVHDNVFLATTLRVATPGSRSPADGEQPDGGPHDGLEKP